MEKKFSLQGFCKGCVGFCVSHCFYCCKGWCKGICKGCVGLPPKSLNLLLQGFARVWCKGCAIYTYISACARAAALGGPRSHFAPLVGLSLLMANTGAQK
jgi:hypothetical protein